MKRTNLTRRTFNILAAGAIGSAFASVEQRADAQADSKPMDLAIVATVSASFVSGDQKLSGLYSPNDPRNSRDRAHGTFGNWPRTGTQWVEYSWSRPVSTDRIDVYFYADGRGLRAPEAYRIQYWNGQSFVNVPDASGLGVSLNRYNTTTFSEIISQRIRLEFDSAGTFSVGILRWRVYDSGKTPPLPPIVAAGPDRIVVGSGRTYLAGAVRTLPNSRPLPNWGKESGAGDVNFEIVGADSTSATFSEPGDYVLRFTASNGEESASDTLRVRVEPPAEYANLTRIYTKPYKITSRLWTDRAKALIVNWIPHCVAELNAPDSPDGGIHNFIEAGNKLSGKPYSRHVGYPWVNAYVHNTIESMCIALQVDPQGDAEIAKAQDAMRATLEDWIPIILAAQEPDGYLQTRFTLDPRNAKHWTLKTEHEGYTAGYFLEAAIAHFILTNGSDRRLYDAAKRLADCWHNNLGPPPKKAWYDGHEELEQALIRFAQLVDETEGAGAGDRYRSLSRFLLDCRSGGDSYDQSQSPVTRQYEAVGHAVRAVYLYKAMSDMAMVSGDVDYQSAIRSIWDNLVNRKLYVTGGVGSGETSEGFGPDYALRNESYCESCSGCGHVFFQHSMNLAYADAKYADLYEQTLYNAVLGGIDLPGTHFTYTNALDERGHRTLWHACPCCVGNIPRTLLQLPTWMYSKSANAIYVNLYIGSEVTIDNLSGTTVTMVQETDYPWNGEVTITVNPAEEAAFAIHLRSPTRDASELYSSTPKADGIASISVNGSPVDANLQNGYLVILRQWKSGDKIQLQLPMSIQAVQASEKIAADRERVALRYGPLVYNIENVDQDIRQPMPANSQLVREWRAGVLNGVQVITGKLADGSPMLAIPNYARNNRGDESTESIVWIRRG
jgi:DUF1680 family protein